MISVSQIALVWPMSSTAHSNIACCWVILLMHHVQQVVVRLNAEIFGFVNVIDGGIEKELRTNTVALNNNKERDYKVFKADFKLYYWNTVR